jgi:hypothetical protein
MNKGSACAGLTVCSENFSDVMKKMKWLGMMGAMMLPIISAYPQPSIPQPPADGQPQAVPSVPADLTPGANEVIRLSEAGSTEEVVLGYVNRSTAAFNLSADDILYLKDIGISSPVITAMLNRDHDLQSQGQAYTYDQKLYAPANPGVVAPQPVAAPAPAPEVVTPEASAPAAVAPAAATPAAATPAPVYVSSPPADVTYFYNDLSPYGTWVQLNGVGWCWQPRVVVNNHAWSPYCNAGYWVYSDAGWYWQSTYSWGWAPFHYGRWHLHPGCGWVWVPDRVWGPAWVVWRSEGDRCGWAPLPPHAEFVAGFGWRFNGVQVAVNFDFGLHPEHYTFVALRDFSHHDLGQCRLAPTEVTRIYNHTTIINNYVVNNNTIVNQGIKVDRVATATHTQIHKVPIREVPGGTTTVAKQGASVIYRPELKAPAARPATMVAQKVDDRHPIIQHTPIMATRVQHNSGPVTKPETMGTPALRTPAPDTKNFSRPVPNTPQENAPRKPYSAAQDSSAINGPAQSASPAAQNHAPQGASPELPASRSVRPAFDESNPHQYYPKGYHQSSEIHSLPPNNGRSNNTPPQSDHGNAQSHKDSNHGQSKDSQ